MAQLVDQWGFPVKAAALKEEIVVPSVTGVRQVFDDVVSSNLNPQRLARILREAAEGDMNDFLTLAEEMEEREWQYRTVLGTRKTAIKGIEPFVKAPTEDAADVKIADAVKDELVDRPDFRDLISDLLDGLGKGYAVVEHVWRTSGNRWSIEGFKYRDPRLFQWDRETRTKLAVRTTSDPDGLPLAPYKFAVHVPRLKSGLPARNGLGRIAAWAYLLKSYTMKDWAAFLEVHGMPLRLGKYGQASSPQDRAILLKAVRNLGSDAAAIIPDGMSIDFVEVKGFSEKPFEVFAKYIDASVAKVVVGQTMTTDDGSSLGQAAIHDKVRIDIKEDDAVEIAKTLNRDVVRPWVDLNFGPQKRYPLIILPVMEREDLAAYSKALGELVDRGLEVEQAEVRDRIGHREPEKGAKLMRPRGGSGETREGKTRPTRPEKTSGDDDEDPEPALNYRGQLRACPTCHPGGLASAFNAELLGDERESLVELALGDWERVMTPVQKALQTAFEEAADFEDLDRRLAALAAELPTDELAREIAVLGMIGRGNGSIGLG